MLRSYHSLPVLAVIALIPRLIVAVEPMPTRATVKNAGGQTLGFLILTQEQDGVRIQGTLKGLPPGLHGIHIHESSSCLAPDFKSAGAHFNPERKQHGDLNPQGVHAGDLGNITVDSVGSTTVNLLAQGTTLNSSSRALLRVGGTSVVIHAAADDRKSDPAGQSGDRIACGSIVSK